MKLSPSLPYTALAPERIGIHPPQHTLPEGTLASDPWGITVRLRTA